LEWACSQCKKKRRHEIHPYTYHLLRLRRLLKAGFPFSKNDLPFEMWEDLGLLNELLDVKTRIF
jgi:hypothetical protein